MVTALARVVPLLLSATLAVAAEPTDLIAYDEDEDGDTAAFDPVKPPHVKIHGVGPRTLRGHGRDSVDDCDAVVFEVAKLPFDFALASDAAEFKKLKRVRPDGSLEEVAFGSTNVAFNRPRNIEQRGLPPGRYVAEMYFGPGGAAGPWLIRVIPRKQPAPDEPLLPQAETVATAAKLKQVDWSGASIFHGHNWGEDQRYVEAIAEAGFNAAGCAEPQIEHCTSAGLKAFLFIWPHEATTIPKKHRDDDAVIAYYLSDRVPPNRWGEWATRERQCFAGDPRHPAIFTLKGTWGGIDRFFPVVRARALEYYHYHWDGDRRPHLRYAILEQARAASLQAGGAPLCRVVETRPEDMRKTRQTLFSSLAYGFRGFRWGGGGLFDPAQRDARGRPRLTKLGDQAREINHKLVPFLGLLDGARTVNVLHTAPLPVGGNGIPEDHWLECETPELLLGEFRQREQRLVVLANRLHDKAREVEIAVRDGAVRSVCRFNPDADALESLKLESDGARRTLKLSLSPGDGELLMFGK